MIFVLRDEASVAALTRARLMLDPLSSGPFAPPCVFEALNCYSIVTRRKIWVRSTKIEMKRLRWIAWPAETQASRPKQMSPAYRLRLHGLKIVLEFELE